MSKKVSIVLIHYNQPLYVKEALKSIFDQTYKNIELIFADDCSTDINIKDLKNYGQKSKIKIQWQINKENMGTVKNINNAIKKCSGDYILIFAADDKLYDKEVISKLVKIFTKQKNDVALVSGQCYMMDKNLKKVIYKYVDPKEGIEFNSLSAAGQYKELCTKCFLAAGACMFDVDILKKEKLFDERYKYIEDWTSFLRLTRKGYKLIYDNSIDALFHRDGGISHNIEIESVDSPIVGFRKDLVNMVTYEILPYFKELDYKQKCKVYEFLMTNKYDCESRGLDIKNKKISIFKIRNLDFFIHRKFSYINLNYHSIKTNYTNVLSIINAVIIAVFLIKKYLKISNLFLSIIMCSFFILDFVVLLTNILLIAIKLLYRFKILKD